METGQAASRRRPRFHSLRVAAIDRLTDDAVALTFDVPDRLRDDYLFEPGQHVTVCCPAAGDDARRTYSLCSVPPVLRIGVKRVPGGVFSSYALEGLRVGEEIEVMTPTGRFIAAVDPPGSSHRAAIVVGSGITPVLSMLQATLAGERASRFTVVYGNRGANTVMFLDELADLKDRYPARLAVHHVFSREERDAPLLTGRLDRAKLDALIGGVVDAGTVDEWFLCGPLGVVAAARAVLRADGVHDARVHFELFHVAPGQLGPPPEPGPAVPRDAARPDDAAAAAVTVRLAGRSTSLRVARDRDVLHAVMQVRADVPYGCTNGMCGTCRARVVEGRVEMDHCYALDSRDLAAGFVLTCQAQPRTERVVLDYDA